MVPVFFALAAAPPDLRSDHMREVLLADAPGLIFGVLFVTLGLVAVALFRLRSRGKDPALLWFGLFAGLYGVRLFVVTTIVPFMFPRLPSVFWSYMEAGITYLIPLPGILFVREIFPDWRPVLRWVVRIQAVFGIIGIALDRILRRPASLHAVNNVIVLGAFVALALATFRHKQRTASLRALQTGIAIFYLTVLLNNLSSLGLFREPINPEPIGFAVFLASLGRVVALRAFDKEERLVAIEKELEVARRIQTSILPREMPRVQQVSIAARYLPMTAVAGDFYDFLILDEHRLGILVADVSGHGVPAALIASMVKVAIAAQLPHADDPARVLAGMNQILCGKLHGQFVTAAYLFVDTVAFRMRYGAAGHPALFWCRSREQRIENVEENGLMLGLMARATYTYTEREISSGDRFLLYTDGLLEANNGTSEFFGDERVRAQLVTAKLLDADQCATSLLDNLARWAGPGRPQEDDLTLIVVDLG